jgi:LuxR family maltose regulon positive regulatory protein
MTPCCVILRALFTLRPAEGFGTMNEAKNFRADIHYYSPRLTKKLEGILISSVTIVEAPSGYGKTTAVRDYLLDNLPKGTPVYWWNAAEAASVDSWERLCREFVRIDPSAGKELLAAGLPKLMSAWETAEIISRIRCETQTVLVLDDFQYLQNELPNIFISELFTCAVENLHLVIITQSLRHFQFSLHAKVNLIRTEDFRFNEEDIRNYCKTCDVVITQNEAKQIYKYTEGWIAALYLMMLQMRRGEGYSLSLGILQLMENIVWKDLSAESRRLFLHIAPFPSVTIEQIGFLLQAAPLPDEVFTLLEETPFIRYAPDERLYVPHAILREMLLRRLAAADEQTKRNCYRRAGDWYARTEDFANALSCYLEAEDYEAILSLPLTQMAMKRINGTPFTRVVSRILESCPEEIKHKHPIALLRIAYSLIGADKKAEAAELMQEIKAIIDNTEDESKQKALIGEWTLVSAFLRYPDIIEMRRIIKEAAGIIGGRCKTFTGEEPFAFGMPMMNFFHKTPGRLEEEIEALADVSDALYLLTGVKNNTTALFKGEAALYRNNLSEAEPFAYQAAYQADISGQWPLRMGCAHLLGHIAFRCGNNSELPKFMKTVEESAEADALSSFVMNLLRSGVYIWLEIAKLLPRWLREGKNDFPDAPSWAKAYAGYIHLLFLLQEHEFARLEGTAAALIDECREQGYLIIEIYLNIISALACSYSGQMEKAMLYLSKALSDALPDRLYAPFIEFRWLIGELLEQALNNMGMEMPSQIAAKGKAFGGDWKTTLRIVYESQTLPYGLTQKENEVATLAAKGLSNREIAEKLFISETTVKFHLRTVFSKLNIDRRSKLAGIME